MPALPLLRPREVILAFERLGWQVARQRSSHIVMTKPGAPATLSIPDHAQVARGTLRPLIAKAGLTLAEFLAQVDRLLNCRQRLELPALCVISRYGAGTDVIDPAVERQIALLQSSRYGGVRSQTL